MTPEETGKLLATCASFDRRTVGDLDVVAWYRVLGDLPYTECEAAVVAHYAESREWIMPADIRGRAKRALRHAEDVAHLREVLCPTAYRAQVDAADSAFMRKLADRTGSTLQITGPPPPGYLDSPVRRVPANPQELALAQAEESRRRREPGAG